MMLCPFSFFYLEATVAPFLKELIKLAIVYSHEFQERTRLIIYIKNILSNMKTPLIKLESSHFASKF